VVLTKKRPLRRVFCKSPITQAAHQHAALRDPDLLIDLLAYQLSHDLSFSKPFGLSLTDVPNWPSTEAEGYELDERLTANPPRDMWDAKDLGASFRAFRKKGADHICAELTRFLAAQYCGGDEKLEALVAKATKPSVREVWTPTAENFFGRVSGPYMVTLWCDFLELTEDHPTVTTFAKLKKGEKVKKLHDLFAKDNAPFRSALGITNEQAARIDAWLPEGMA
jgi:ParB family chromosome partitioning protein